MGSGSKHTRTGFIKDEVAPKTGSAYNTVLLRLIYDCHLKISGPVTGEKYEWLKIGDVNPVRKEDAEPLVNKRIGGRSCCGGSNQDGNKLFEYA